MVPFTVPDLQFLQEFYKDLSFPEILTFGLLILSVLLILCLSVVKVYRKIRNSIPAKVNCWFCNEDAKVPYLSRDGWMCPSCQQYNGFNEDGSYNKRIPAQFIQALNRPIFGNGAKAAAAAGSRNQGLQLCDRCNLNLELKYFQLAQYVPVKEDKYDEEIEAEQLRLDQVYDICAPCKLIVKRISTVKGNGSSSRNATPVVRETIDERPRRPSTPVPMPHLQRQLGNHRQSESMQILNGLPRGEDNSDLSFGAKLNQLHIGIANNNIKPKTSPSSIFGGSNTSRVGGNINNTSICQPFMSSSPPPPSSISGYFDSTEKRGPEFYKSWQNQNQPLYPSSYLSNNMNQYQQYPTSSSLSAYNYRSSSVASVFGGRKPLLSPSRLAAGSLCLNNFQRQDSLSNLNNHPANTATEFRHYNQQQVCYCHHHHNNGLSTAYGAYGIVYGNTNNNMHLSSCSSPTTSGFISSSPAEQYNNNSCYMLPQPRSNSSSQSSGFVSISPTPPSRFSTTPNSGSQDSQVNNDDDEPLFTSAASLTSRSRADSIRQELRRRGQFTKSPSLNQSSYSAASPPASRPPSYVDRCRDAKAKSLTARKFLRLRKTKKPAEEDPDLMFSDDEIDEANDARRKQTRLGLPKNKKNLFRNNNGFIRGVRNYVAATFSITNLVRIFLQGFIFINVLLLFCILFVGKWPEPMLTIISTAFDFYQQLFDDYVLPLILLFETFVNKVLSYIIPDGSDEILDDEAVQRVLFQ